MKEAEKDEQKLEMERQARARNPGTRIATDADMARLSSVEQPETAEEAPGRPDK